MQTAYVQSQVIATLIAGETSVDGIRKLMQQISSAAAVELSKEEFTDVAFDLDGSPQWATLKFRDKKYWRRWIIGLQFVRAPTEQSGSVEVLMRYYGEEQNNTPSPSELSPLLPKIKSALERASVAPSV